MKVSVIIPVYNSEKYLCECLDSILSQDSNDFEIICIDDGSSDTSLDILESYKNRFNNMKIVVQSHLGLSAARNKGINCSNGEYIYFVDSDDIVIDGYIKKAYEACKKYELDVFLFSFENFCDDYETSLKYKDRINKAKRIFNSKKVFTGLEMMEQLISRDEYYNMVWIQMVNRRFLIANSIFFYEGIIFEDILYTFKLLMKSNRVFCSKEIGYRKRIHNNSICGKPENIDNVESLWVTLKELIVICRGLQYETKTKEFVVLNIIKKVKRQLALHFSRLTESDKYLFLKRCGKYDRILFEVFCSD